MAADTRCFRTLLTDDFDHFPDTCIVEDGICVHTSEEVDFFETVGDEEFREFVEYVGSEHGLGFFVAAVEIIEHASNED